MKKITVLLMLIAVLAAPLMAAEDGPIGIITAMSNELSLLLENADVTETRTIGGVDYNIGTLEGQDVVLVKAGIGKIMAAAGAAAVMGLDNLLGANLDCLKDFQGVKRRQQIIARGNGIVAIEDFGHHPTAISLTLDALRQRFKGYKIFAAFEPRSNTARTNVFEGEFASALRKADKAYVGKLSNADKIPADRRMDTAALAALSGMHCRAFEDNLELLKTLKADAAADDCNKVVVFFSNGSFDSIHKLFAADIPSR